MLFNPKEAKWTESVAVGSRDYVEMTKTQLGIKAKGRKIEEQGGIYSLRERMDSYNAAFDPKKVGLSLKNTYFWNDLNEITI